MPENAPFPRVAPLSVYALAGVAAATLTGYYVDSTGAQVGAAFSYTIPTTGATFTSLAGGTLPAGAVGVIGDLAVSAIYVGRGGAAAGTITTGQTPAAGYPQIAIGAYVTFGRVL